MHDGRLEALNEFVSNIGAKASRENLYPICFDPTNQHSVAAACKRIREDFGTVFVLVNNVGFQTTSNSQETTMDEWRRVFAQNVDSALLMSKEWLPTMRERQWGRIINTCSLAAKTGGVTTGIAYATSKGALHTLTFALARECAKDKVTVNGIAPAYVRSAAENTSNEMVDMLLKYIPVGRFCEPEEYAHAVEFLISPLAGFITGEIIDMNGGLFMD